MNSFMIICITIILNVCAFAVPIDDGINEQSVGDRICMPGANYFDGCNTVSCFPNHAVVRTEKACFELDSNGQQVPVPEIEAPEDFWQETETKKPDRICKPDASYFDGCNRVWCGPNNLQISTQKACFQLDLNGRQVPITLLEAPEDFWEKIETKKPDRICKPGASYFDGCNTVSCGPNNVQYQTLIGCDMLDANGKWHTKPVLEAPEDFWQKE